MENKQPKQPVTWLPAVLDLLTAKGQVTSRELAAIVGARLGGDAVTRCRQIGLPLKTVGSAPGSNNRNRFYALDIAELWSALEESLNQQARYARLLTMQDGCPRLSFATPAAWIAHLRKLANSAQPSRPEIAPL